MTTSTRPPFERTVCACDEDRAHCKTRPGHMIPSDVPRIAGKLIELGLIEAPEQVCRYLRASAGSRIIIVDRRTGDTTVFVTPSIVPARYQGGRCVFLTEDERCRIHAVSPFGCAYFDAHMSLTDSQHRVLWGMEEMATNDAYQQLRGLLLPKDIEPTESAETSD